MKKMQRVMVAMTLAALMGWSAGTCAGSVNLVGNMQAMQYFTHKAYLSMQANNAPLMDFYLHEMEETIEALEEIDEYKGMTIGPLVKSMLLPRFVKLEEAFDKNGAAQTANEFSQLIDACNQCHTSTGRGYIEIQVNDSNPYFQSFKPVSKAK